MTTQREEFPINSLGRMSGKVNCLELARQIMEKELQADGSYDVHRVQTLLRARIDRYPESQRCPIPKGCIKNAAAEIRHQLGLKNPRTGKMDVVYRKGRTYTRQKPKETSAVVQNKKETSLVTEILFSAKEIVFAYRTAQELRSFGSDSAAVLDLIRQLSMSTNQNGDRP